MANTTYISNTDLVYEALTNHIFKDHKETSKYDAIYESKYLGRRIVNWVKKTHSREIDDYEITSILRQISRDTLNSFYMENTYREGDRYREYMILIPSTTTITESKEGRLKRLLKEKDKRLEERKKISSLIDKDNTYQKEKDKVTEQAGVVQRLQSELYSTRRELENIILKNQETFEFSKIKALKEQLEYSRSTLETTLKSFKGLNNIRDYQKIYWHDYETELKTDIVTKLEKKYETDYALISPLRTSLEDIRLKARDENLFPAITKNNEKQKEIQIRIDAEKVILAQMEEKLSRLRQKLRRPVKNIAQNSLVMNL